MTSIIIVSYNRLDLIKKCLPAAVKNSPPNTEIILVDNNSSEDIVGFIKEKYPQVKIIPNKENKGFAVGSNQGAKLARKNNNLLFLNTDAFLEPGTIEALENFLKTHPRAGAVAPQLRNADGSIQPSGGYFPYLFQIFLLMTFLDNLPIVKKFAPSIHVRDKNYFTEVRQFDWLAGACLLVPKEVFKKTRGFDEKMFMYGEELEWCYRIKKAGYQIYLNPIAQLIHLGFASSASQQFGIIKEFESFIYFYKKHQPVWQLPILIFLLTLGCLFRILRGIITLNPLTIKTYSQALKQIYKTNL